MARPKKEINWEIVVKQMEAGLTAKQIAHNKIHITHFYKRFKKEFGCDFANYANDTYESGDGSLKFVQYMKALAGHSKELDKLCNIRLGQSTMEQEKPPNDDLLTARHENMILRAKIEKMRDDQHDDKHETE